MKKLWKENRVFILFILLMVFFRSTLADWNAVPTGSMKPTIVEGDRIWVNRIAYDLRVPFTDVSILNINQPKRGDIIVFNSKAADKRLVKRVVGLPGDTVEMRSDHLIVNGQSAEYQFKDNINGFSRFVEKLGSMEHDIRVTQQPSGFNSFAVVKVPEGMYFVLGDNRHNSADSRVYGFVPHAELIGRAKSVVMSLDYNDYYLPRIERFFHSMD